MTREDPQLKLRLPADLKKRIEAAAKVNNRSVNAEIVNRLEVSLYAWGEMVGKNVVDYMSYLDHDSESREISNKIGALILQVLKDNNIVIDLSDDPK